MIIVPAYGRNYKSRKQVLAAWNDNHDFIIRDSSHPDNGRYVSKHDLEKFGPEVTEVKIRYYTTPQWILAKYVFLKKRIIKNDAIIWEYEDKDYVDIDENFPEES